MRYLDFIKILKKYNIDYSVTEDKLLTINGKRDSINIPEIDFINDDFEYNLCFVDFKLLDLSKLEHIHDNILIKFINIDELYLDTLKNLPKKSEFINIFKLSMNEIEKIHRDNLVYLKNIFKLEAIKLKYIDGDIIYKGLLPKHFDNYMPLQKISGNIYIDTSDFLIMPDFITFKNYSLPSVSSNIGVHLGFTEFSGNIELKINVVNNQIFYIYLNFKNIDNRAKIKIVTDKKSQCYTIIKSKNAQGYIYLKNIFSLEISECENLNARINLSNAHEFYINAKKIYIKKSNINVEKTYLVEDDYYKIEKIEGDTILNTKSFFLMYNSIKHISFKNILDKIKTLKLLEKYLNIKNKTFHIIDIEKRPYNFKIINIGKYNLKNIVKCLNKRV